MQRALDSGAYGGGSNAEALARAVIGRVEALRTRSAAVLRGKVYEGFAAAGIDVGKLVSAARAAEIERRRLKLRHSRRLNTLLQRRIDSGVFVEALLKKAAKGERPPPTQAEIDGKIAEAKTRLASAPKRFADYEAAIAQVLKRPPAFPSDPAPTAERVRQEGVLPREELLYPQDEASSPRRHRFDAPLERAMGLMPAESYNAAALLRWAHEKRTARPATGSYGQGTGRGAKADRLGLSPEQEKAARIWRYVWDRLGPEMRFIASALVLQEPVPVEEKTGLADKKGAAIRRRVFRKVTAEEFGKAYGATQDARRANGVAEGALKLCSAHVAMVVREYAAWWSEERTRRRARVTDPDPKQSGERNR